MRRMAVIAMALLVLIGCSRRAPKASASIGVAYGAAIAEVSGGKQIVAAGVTLDQPVVVQVNDSQGNGVAGAYVEVHGPAGVICEPASGLTDSGGQFSVKVTLGVVAGRYQLTAITRAKDGKSYELSLDEIALDYQQVLGRQLNQQYCARCHDAESTPERVSNIDNLATKPHVFTDGDALNRISDADLTAIISHGGAALNKSAEMPPYGYTLSNADIQALLSYIRAIADPPYPTKGVIYANK